MENRQPPLILAVPDLESYRPNTGIGRVFYSLSRHWEGQVQPINATLQARRLPILRNFPFRVRVPAEAQLVLLPRTTGAQALQDTQGVPSMVVVHDIGAVEYPPIDQKTMDPLTYLSILRGFYGIRSAARIVTDSHFTHQRLVRRLPEVAGRITVIHAGVDESFLQHPSRQDEARQRIVNLIGRPLRSPLLVYVGTEAPRKNIARLLEVFSAIKKRHPSAQLLKVGGPGRPAWRKQTLQTIAHLGLEVGDDVILAGVVDDAALADAYCAADLFVSASLYEGFGLPALEAMAVGTPVVVSNRGSFPEVVEKIGWTVEPEIAPFVQAIEQALHDPRRAERQRAGREHAATFTWSRAAKQYLEVMRQIVGSGPGKLGMTR